MPIVAYIYKFWSNPFFCATTSVWVALTRIVEGKAIYGPAVDGVVLQKLPVTRVVDLLAKSTLNQKINKKNK